MLRYSVFPPKDAEPQLIIARPNDLGLPLDSKTDNHFRTSAHELADSMSAVVIAYERPGTGSSRRTFNMGLRHALQPSRYAETASHTGRILEAAVAANGLRKMVLADSSGGFDSIMVARSQMFKTDYLAVGDSVGMKQMNKTMFFSQWLSNQLLENHLKAPEDPQGALIDETISPSNLEMALRAISEVGLYVDAWRSPIAREAASDIAWLKDFGHITVNIAFSARPFIITAAEQLALVGYLNSQAPEDRAAPFRAHIVPDTLHSYFNDTQNSIDLANDTLALGLESIA